VLSIYSLKPRFQGLLRPLVRSLANTGITANHITTFGCVLSVTFGLLLATHADAHGWWLLLAPFLLFRMALNAMDGIMAREFGQESNLGAYLNELCDVVSDSFLVVPFAYLPNFDPLWVGAVIVLVVISEMSGTLAIAIGSKRRYDGPMGKSDRAVVFGLCSLWIGMGLSLAPWFSYWFLGIIVLLLVVTIVNRVRKGLAEADSRALKAGVS
jgi:CDP-diacylglycerol--glycerol-3-phosphate 3-phosphatidyltransferase